MPSATDSAEAQTMIELVPKRKSQAPQWQQVHLSASQLVANEHERMKMLFSWFYAAADKPLDMSLWCIPATSGGADMYLSPACTQLAGDLLRSYHARPCAPPQATAVMIAGTAGAHARKYYSQAVDRLPSIPEQQLLPARYSCRSIGSLQQAGISSAWLYYSQQMAPFVQRFALAWTLLSAPATGNKQWASRAGIRRRQ